MLLLYTGNFYTEISFGIINLAKWNHISPSPRFPWKNLGSHFPLLDFTTTIVGGNLSVTRLKGAFWERREEGNKSIFSGKICQTFGRVTYWTFGFFSESVQQVSTYMLWTLESWAPKNASWRNISFRSTPPSSNSHHQDYYSFSRESQPKPTFCHCYWVGGVDPISPHLVNLCNSPLL